MSNINNYLSKMLSARFGKDVRQTIHDAILEIDGVARTAQNSATASASASKASEASASASASSAKTSATLAEQYKKDAFAGTPEGYAALVENVRLMDIKETTDTTLADSKAGGYKLVSMSGKSVQNGTPTPDTPQSINNVADCVEMEQGSLSSTDGRLTTATTIIRSKHFIPCKSGDAIKIVPSFVPSWINVYYYNDNGFQDVTTITGTGDWTAIAPSGATKFKYVVSKNDGITPDTVGKITLTINGKYVLQFVENGKNLLNLSDASIHACTYDESTGIFKSNVNSSYYCDITTMKLNDLVLSNLGKTLTFSVKQLSGTKRATGVVIYGERKNGSTYQESSSGTITIADDFTTIRMIEFRFNRSSPAFTDTESTFTDFQVEIGEATEYEPYTETVATVLLNEPLRESDVMSRTDVVRKRRVKTFNSKDGIYDKSDIGTVLRVTIKILGSMASIYAPSKCTHLPIGLSYTQDSEHYYVSGEYVFFFINKSRLSSTDETGIGEYLASNPITVEYELEEEVIETLDIDSKIALNNLETFDTVTYINVDSRVQPSEIKGEYGTSMVGARTIKNELRNDTLEIKYNELAVALVATESGV